MYTSLLALLFFSSYRAINMQAEYRYVIYDQQTIKASGKTKSDAIAAYRFFSPVTLGLFTVTVRIDRTSDAEPKYYALPIEAKTLDDLINQLKPYPEMAQEAAEKRIWENPPKATLQKTDGSQKTDAPLNWTHIGAAFATGAVLATVVTVLVK